MCNEFVAGQISLASISPHYLAETTEAAINNTNLCPPLHPTQMT